MLFLLTLTSNVSGQDISKYHIPNLESVEDYQAYVGKELAYVPSSSAFGISNWENWGRDVRPIVIKSIEGKTKKGKTFQKMTWTLSSPDGLKTSVITVYSGSTNKYLSSYSKEYAIKDIPLFDLKKWKDDNKSFIGKEYTNPLVKASYKVLDFRYGITKGKYSFDKKLSNLLLVQNSITKDTMSVEADKASFACFEEDLKGEYHSYLSKVEKPSNPAVKYGKTKTIDDSNKGITKYSYIDNFIDIIIFGNSQEFAFTLKNISTSTQKLIWDDAVFVDYKGSTSKVMHAGIRYSERENTQPASTIIKGASLDDIACPTSNVYYSDLLKEWTKKSMYPKVPSKEVKQVSLMLPIQIKDIVNEYIFVFDIKYEYEHPDRLNL